MIDPGMPIGPLDAAGRSFRAERTAPKAGRDAGFDAVLTRELDAPPPELGAQVNAAARRWEELRAMGRELRFEHDPQSGRIVVEVRDLDGRVLGTVPPSGALDIAAGAPLP